MKKRNFVLKIPKTIKCCSRSTLGLIIGSLNVLAYIASCIYLIYILDDVNSTENPSFMEKERILPLISKIIIIFIIFCIAMTIISGLLIMGIVKRRHKLLMPWLIVNGICFILNSVNFVLNLIGFIYSLPGVGILGIGISYLMLWLIFTLYGDILRENAVQQTKDRIKDEEMVY